MRLQAEKFDLLQPSGGRRSTQPASPALTASLKALEELQGVIAIHLKVSRRLVEGRVPGLLALVWMLGVAGEACQSWGVRSQASSSS